VKAGFVFLAALAWCVSVLTQTMPQTLPQTPPSAPAGAAASQRPSITLQDAIQRAKLDSAEFRAALTAAGLAREDVVQARAALLPGINYTTGAIRTEPNQTPSGRFISSNGPNEYISQGSAQETIGFTGLADYRRSHAAAALAKAKAEIAARGLVATVVQDFYGAIVAQRSIANAEAAAGEARRFVQLSEQLEKGGEVAHADAIKARLQANDRELDLQNARLAEENARLSLAVLIFPAFTQDFELVDDLRFPPPLPAFPEAEKLAAQNNPEIAVALAATAAAAREVDVARGGHLPSLTFAYFYGIDAPDYATRSDGVRNLGYQYSATLQLPVFSWGATQSKVRQAELQEKQAKVELSAAQRQALANLRIFYAEAAARKDQIDTLRQSADLAAESLRLTNLRYRAGEAGALEVVDAQNALALARNNFDDGEARYRVALANLQTLTGAF